MSHSSTDHASDNASCSGARFWLEWPVVVTLLVICSAVLLSVLPRIQMRAERLTVEAEVKAMQIELLDVVAHQQIHGGRLPESDNPFDWFSYRPQSVCSGRAAAANHDQQGCWYFDTRRHWLIYLDHQGGEMAYQLTHPPSVNAVVGMASVRLIQVGGISGAKP